MRQEYAVLAERHTFGRRPKPRAAEQKPETALEKSQAPRVGHLRLARPARTDIAHTYSRFRSLLYPTQKKKAASPIFDYSCPYNGLDCISQRHDLHQNSFSESQELFRRVLWLDGILPGSRTLKPSC